MTRLALTMALVIFSSASVLVFAQDQPPPPPGERAAQDQPPPPPVDRADRSPSDKFAPGPVQGPKQAPIQAPLPPKSAAVQAPQQAPMQKGAVQKGGYTARGGGDYRSYSYEPGFGGYDSYSRYDDGRYYGGFNRMGSRPAWRNATIKASGRY